MQPIAQTEQRRSTAHRRSPVGFHQQQQKAITINRPPSEQTTTLALSCTERWASYSRPCAFLLQGTNASRGRRLRLPFSLSRSCFQKLPTFISHFFFSFPFSSLSHVSLLLSLPPSSSLPVSLFLSPIILAISPLPTV